MARTEMLCMRNLNIIQEMTIMSLILMRMDQVL